MRLLLLGATGRTGRELLRQAVERGHDVKAFVRNPGKLDDIRGVDLRVGSVLDASALDQALQGREAVLSTLGSRRPAEVFGTSFMTDVMQALVPGMERRGVRRLIVLSAAGVGDVARYGPRPTRMAFRTALRAIGRDKARSEALVRRTDLDWTFVYPPALTKGPLTKDYRAAEDLRLKGMARIRRADVAHFMLDQLQDASFSRRNAVIGV